MQGKALFPDTRAVQLYPPAPALPVVLGLVPGSGPLAERDPGVAEQGIQLTRSPAVQPSCKQQLQWGLDLYRYSSLGIMCREEG